MCMAKLQQFETPGRKMAIFDLSIIRLVEINRYTYGGEEPLHGPFQLF